MSILSDSLTCSLSLPPSRRPSLSLFRNLVSFLFSASHFILFSQKASLPVSEDGHSRHSFCVHSLHALNRIILYFFIPNSQGEKIWSSFGLLSNSGQTTHGQKNKVICTELSDPSPLCVGRELILGGGHKLSDTPYASTKFIF